MRRRPGIRVGKQRTEGATAETSPVRRRFGSLKVERLNGKPLETARQTKNKMIAWLLWRNQIRMHSTFNYVSRSSCKIGFQPEDRRMSARAIEIGGGNGRLWRAWEGDFGVLPRLFVS